MQIDSSFRHYLIRSQLLIYATWLICILLAPASLSANSGLSYFGVHKLTIVPFSFGMLASAYFILKSLHFQSNEQIKSRWFNYALRAIALCMVGIIITPYSFGSWFDTAHRTFGISLFSIQLLLALWQVFIKRSWSNYGLLALQITGGLISLVYLNPTHGYLIQGQLLFQMAFSIILLRNLRASSD